MWSTQLTVIYEEIVSTAMNTIKNLRRRQKVNRDGKGRSVEGKSPSIDPGRTMRPVKTTLHLSLAVVLIGGLFMPRQAEAAYGNGYAFRREIDIVDAKVVSGPHTNFPILISETIAELKTTANSGKVENASGYDIIFTSDQAGTTQLAHEIESYDASTGQVVMWVRVESLAATT